jgi:beta-lactamase regulating signal transducer with metallopeptidase domain
MIEQINTIAQSWWDWMWPMFWQVSVLIILISVVDLLLQKSIWPQIRYALWLLILVKLMLPPSFSMSTSVISQALTQADGFTTQMKALNNPVKPIPVELRSETNTHITDIGIETFSEPEATMSSVANEPPVLTVSSDIAGSDVNIKIHWQVYVMVVWFVVMVALFSWATVRFRKLRKFHVGEFSGADLPQWFGLLLAETAKKLGLQRLPEIGLSRHVSSPAVFGTFRPVLVLPAAAVNHLSRKHTEHILLHELAHIKRGDLLVNTFYMLLQIVYWFNPLLWLVRRKLQHLRELCCDATVAGILRDETVHYRDTILEVTQRFLSKPAEPGIGLLGMVETSSRLLVRLKWLEKKTWQYRGVRFAIIFIVVGLMSACVLPMAKAKSAAVSAKTEAAPVNPSDIALLYHSNPDIRIKTIKMLASSNDSGLIDDLIRAHSVENYTPVHNEYGRVLQSLTGNRNVRGKSAWKAWLAGEVEAGRLKIDYLPIKPAADVRSEILSFALVGPDGFNEMAAALTAAAYDRQKCHDALRYMVFNDRLAQVQKFLSGDWLSSLFAHREININDIGYFLNGLANPGPLRKQIDTHVRNCLNSDNPVVVANALNLIAGVEVFSTRFIVPDAEDKVTELTSSSVPEIAKQAQRALERIRPGDARTAFPPPTSLESLAVVKDLPGALVFHGRYRHRSGGRDYREPGELWFKQDKDGAITAIAHLAFMATTTIASGDRHNRLTHYKEEKQTSSTGQSGYSIDLELLDSKVLLTRRGIRQDCDGKELKVPEGALFSPNSRPDSYCAANILLRGFNLEEGRSKEFRVYDWDNSGEAMADYTIRIEHVGTESVDVPAGTFKANHIVLTQVTSADTWFKKRAGHVTDFWVLDNGVVVRILRHREPYEIQLLDYTAPAELPGKSAGSEQTKAATVGKSGLQRMIDSAQPDDTVIIPKGVYNEPVAVTKPLTLKGESMNDCIIEVTANEPAIFVDTKGKGKVNIEAVTIKWQLATSDKCEHPFAVAVKDSNVEVKNCYFQPLGNFKRCPVAINSMGFAELNINTCRFEGFEYTVCFGQDTKGTIRHSIIVDSGHQGISLYAGATAEITGNVVTGSRYHAVRSTGGTLNMKDNLIINNANRGVYLGNKSARGTIANNVIIGNGTGIGGFARSNVKVENNVIADSIYAGIGMRGSCSLSIRDNIFRGNERGWILFKETGGNSNSVYKNVFWNNKIETENLVKTSDSITADPGFADADNGDFSLKPGPALRQKQGLTNPEIFRMLWKRWQNRADKNEPFTGISAIPK